MNRPGIRILIDFDALVAGVAQTSIFTVQEGSEKANHDAAAAIRHATSGTQIARCAVKLIVAAVIRGATIKWAAALTFTLVLIGRLRTDSIATGPAVWARIVAVFIAAQVGFTLLADAVTALNVWTYAAIFVAIVATLAVEDTLADPIPAPDCRPLSATIG
jgi:hypothetical protein